MKDLPEIRDFQELGKAFDLYRYDFVKTLTELLMPYKGTRIHENNLERLSEQIEEARGKAHSRAIGNAAQVGLRWLNSQPGFMIAAQTVGVSSTEEARWTSANNSALQRWVTSSAPTAAIAHSLARMAGMQLAYASNVADATHKYLSGTSRHLAIEGPASLAAMKQLLIEFDTLLAVEWVPELTRRQLSELIKAQRAISFIEHLQTDASPVSKRNDADLAGRLFVSELLRSHQNLFSAFHKRAVFQLAGLPFVEKPIEMKTIDRMVAIEKGREGKPKSWLGSDTRFQY
jgi:hypothetical protein